MSVDSMSKFAKISKDEVDISDIPVGMYIARHPGKDFVESSTK